MARGPKPTPTKVKKLKGNPGKRKTKTDNEPSSGNFEIKRTPAHLSLIGKQAFKDLVKLVGPEGMKILDNADSMAIEILAETYSEWRELHEEVLKLGMTQEVKTKQGGVMIRQNPAVGMRADAARRLVAMMGEFGLTPSSRSKLIAGDPDAGDPLAELIKQQLSGR